MLGTCNRPQGFSSVRTWKWIEVRSNRRGQLSSLVLVQYTVTVLYQMWWQLQNQNDFLTAFWDDEKHWRSPRKPILSSLSFLLFPLRPLLSPSWVFTLLSSEFSSWSKWFSFTGQVSLRWGNHSTRIQLSWLEDSSWGQLSCGRFYPEPSP